MRRPCVPFSIALFAMIACLSAGAASAGPGQGATGERVEAWRATCTHYVNRARFRSREERVDFVTVLADGCEAALVAFAPGGDGRARQAAGEFLDRLTGARAAIAEINGRRLAEAAARRAQDRSFTRVVRDLSRELRLVGSTGEYLILRAEGVYDALEAWVDAGAEFALIAALPRRDG